MYVRTYGHWAVYNEQGIFYDFDDGDATDDFYDYDSADGLPAGCEFSTPNDNFLDGAPLDLSKDLGGVPVPAPAPAAARVAAPVPSVLPPEPAAAATQAPGAVTQRFVSLQKTVPVVPTIPLADLAPQPEVAPLPDLAPLPEFYGVSSGARTYVEVLGPAPGMAALSQGEILLGPILASTPAPAPSMAAVYQHAGESITCKPTPTRTEQT